LQIDVQSESVLQAPMQLVEVGGALSSSALDERSEDELLDE
jgi:hypothetical protein